MDRVFELMDEEYDIEDKQGALRITELLKVKLQFRNVIFNMKKMGIIY